MSLDLLLGANDGPALAGLAWLLTYLLHSTLLLGGTWVLLRYWRTAGDALQEFLWKFALLGGLASATLQVFGGIETAGGVLQLNAVGTATSIAAPADHAGDAGSLFGLMNASENRQANPTPFFVSPPFGGIVPATAEVAATPAATDTAVVQPEGLRHATLLWAALAALALAAPTLWAYRRTRRMLAHRTRVSGSQANDELAAICCQAGVTRRVALTRCAAIPAPVSLGILRWEICVPPRALHDLPAAERRAMLAHELAHLVRRDPVWLAFCRTLETWLFFQPLNRVARRRLQEIAEYRCDAWAAQVNRDGGLSLARCLAEVAEWLIPPHSQTTGYAAMAEHPSHLSRRIRRLLMPQRADRSARFAPALAAMLLAPLTFAAPTISPRAVAEQVGVLLPPETLPLEGALVALEHEIDLLDSELSNLSDSVSNSKEAAGFATTLEELERETALLRELLPLPKSSQE